jgi:oxygen-independent coproporphyrinogen III oxidase
MGDEISIIDFGDALQLAEARMREAFARVPETYWVGRDAFSFRFDNARYMAERSHRRITPSDDEVDRALSAVAGSQPVGVYAGLPWCVQTCSFCTLSYGSNPRTEERQKFVRLLHREIDLQRNRNLGKQALNSCYFGGGTPTILAPEMLGEWIDGVLEQFEVSPRTVITCEVSPATVTERKLDVLERRATRISVGVQSTDSELRRAHGRLLERERVLDQLRMICKRFSLVNADVMYGLADQGLDKIYRTLVDLIGLGIPSITYYRTELFPGTKDYDRARVSPWDTVPEKQARRQYFFGQAVLEAAGYTQNPLGWFVRNPDARTRAPWSAMINNWSKVVPYFGFGVGAFSISEKWWMQCTESIPDWTARVEAGRPTVATLIPFDDTERFMIRFMRHLRAHRRIPWRFLVDESGHTESRLHAFFGPALAHGLFQSDGDELVLTDAGEALVHWIIDDLALHLVGRERRKVVSLPVASGDIS